jgi:NADH:ubiquinone oxidoreductase subunit B-like Fe-S oxidoreductase
MANCEYWIEWAQEVVMERKSRVKQHQNFPFFRRLKELLGEVRALWEFPPTDAWKECCSTYILTLQASCCKVQMPTSPYSAYDIFLKNPNANSRFEIVRIPPE